ncbi:MAG TPA: apolipoprotein N-acyltransferase [Gemmatimonadales bacterium]|nr:apolipoprotein N-acyltransferase [Gemmatimonadales bacterium]
MKLVALGAIALFLSYPPFPLPPLSFVALIPAVLLVRQALQARDARAAFRWGWWYGLAANGLVLYWMVIALWHFTPFSALGYLATVATIALMTGCLFWFVVRVRLTTPAVPLWVIFPVAWTALEWIIGHIGDIAFPWLGLGTSLADAPVLVQWADLAGARGVTLWLAWCNVVILDAWLDRRSAWSVVRGAWPVLATVVLALGYGVWREQTLPVREVGVVALIQPNEGFREKWDPAREDAVVGKLLDMSEQSMKLARPQLVVWPEAAIPGFLFQQPEWDQTISGLARVSHTPIVAGGLYAETRMPPPVPYYNAVFFFDSTGDRRSHPVYGKHYLVPIVERVPFVPVRWMRKIPGLGRWSGGFARGTDLPVYQSAIGKFGVIICYESAFEDLPRRYRALGAEFLVNVTNDVWFGRTAAPRQHASHLVLRAIESRMGIARAANSGISEFVDPLGHAYDASALGTEAIVTGRLRTSDVITLYVRWGDWVGSLVVLATLGFVVVLVMNWWQTRSTHAPRPTTHSPPL